MHCLTVTHGMQEFTSPQSVDGSVKTLKQDSFSSSPPLFSLWPQPLPFFISVHFTSIQFNSILFYSIYTTPKQQSSQGASHSLFCLFSCFYITLPAPTFSTLSAGSAASHTTAGSQQSPEGGTTSSWLALPQSG